MSDTKSFQCPNCGSPIRDITGNEREVKCAYCGSSVIVPEELRNQSQPSQPFPTPAMYVSTFQSDELVQDMAQAGKVAAGVATGVAAVTTIVPIAITVLILCVTVGIVGAVLWSVNSAFKQGNQIESTAMAPFVQMATQAFPTEAPTYTPAPTPTTEPTTVPTPINTPVAFKKVLFKDTFTNPSSGWSISHDSNYTMEYKNGKYHVLVNKQDGGQIVWLSKTYTDSSTEVDVQQTAGPGEGQIGLACRASDAGSLYSFEFSQNGSYGIYKYTDWNSDALAEGTLDPNTIEAGSVIHLEGICDGQTLTLALNGTPLLQAQDSDYTRGSNGLIIRTAGNGDPGIDVLFSNYIVKGP